MNRPLFGTLCAATFICLLGAGCGSSSSPAPVTPTTSSSTTSAPTSTVMAPTGEAPSQYFTARYQSSVGGITLIRNDQSVSAVWDEPSIGQWSGYGSMMGNEAFSLIFYRHDHEDVTPSLSATWTSMTQLDGTFVDEKHATHTLQLVQQPLGVALNVVHVKKEQKPKSNMSCTYEVNYPELQPTSGLSETVRKQVNAELAKQAIQAYVVSEGATNTKMTIDDAVKGYMNGCLDGLQTMEGGDQDTSNDPIEWYQSTNFNVTLNQNNVFSIQFNSDEFAGGAHGSHGLWAETFDLNTGKTLGIADLLREDQWKPFFRMEAKDLLKQEAESSFLDETVKGSFETLAKDTKPMTADERKEFMSDKNFYLTPTSIVIFYNEYEIAPYSSGQPASELYFTDIKSMLKDGSIITKIQ